jgi:putative peptide zinc metalloprotease protein
MKTDTPASDLERRKKVRLHVRQDLAIAPQKYEGRTYYVVKDPVSLRYYRFKEQEYFLIQLMDGRHTLDDAQKEFEKRFRPDRLTLEDLEGFGQQLLTAGLAQNESPQAGKQLFDRRKKRRRSEILQALTNILYIKVPVYDPDKLLTRMLRYTRWMFTTWFLLLSVGVMLSAILLVLTHFQTFRDRLPDYHEFFSFKTVVYLWVALGVVKVIHEFGHGLSCKAFGGEVHEMGLLLLCLSPCLYCNVSDAWTLPSKWKRIIISGAGIYVELIIASIATFVWWNTPGQPFVNYMSLSLMIVCSVSTIVFNANPLMRYDGYYVLADWLEIPNLRDRSNRYLQRLVMDYCLGIEVQPEPYMELWRRILFLTYAVISYIYRWVITFVILYFMSNFLGPKLKVISQAFVLMAVGSMIGWPIYRLGKNLHKRGRIPDMKMVRVSISASVLALILLMFFFLPLPVSRVRQTGLVQIQPDAIQPVHIEVPGQLEKILVKNGQRVQKGTALAVFTNVKLLSKEAELRNRYDILETNLLRLKVGGANSPELVRSLRSLEGQRDAAKKQLQIFQKNQLARLVVRAPRAGVVMGLPKVDEIGKSWEVGRRFQDEREARKGAIAGETPDEAEPIGAADQEKPFCYIGEPNNLRILVPVSPSDYELIRADLNYFKEHNQPLEVTLRVHGRDSHTWNGELTLLPTDQAKFIPIQLSNKGGGPLAIKTTSQRDQYVPQNQVYLLGIDIKNPDDAISPGSLAQVKIHCKYRTCAWYVWRWIALSLDLRLSY